MKKKRTPQEWQTKPENVKTERVQYWQNGIMVTARMSLNEARNLVKDGFAFVISEQAIGCLKNGEYAS